MKALLLRNLYMYGHPAAFRAWSKTGDSFIMDEFNKSDDDFKVHKCIMDPCLFRFTRGDDAALMLIHFDDCDLIGNSTEMMKEIMSRFDSKWGCKHVDSSFVLGVQRIVTPIENGIKFELPMSTYIEGVYESFKDDLTGMKSHVSTPFPDNIFISRDKSKLPRRILVSKHRAVQ